ncbi:MAG TPA: hypothetical protein VGM90_18200 [Kofleriaceae bacterium]
MNKMSFRVSGSRVGDAVRPILPTAESTRTKQLGVRVLIDRPIVVPPAPVFGPEDYATADDYE